LWGSQSGLLPAFSRLSASRGATVSTARERVFFSFGTKFKALVSNNQTANQHGKARWNYLRIRITIF